MGIILSAKFQKWLVIYKMPAAFGETEVKSVRVYVVFLKTSLFPWDASKEGSEFQASILTTAGTSLAVIWLVMSSGSWQREQS